MVTEVVDIYKIIDSEDLITISDKSDNISVVDAPDGIVTVIESTENYNIIDSSDSLKILDSEDVYNIKDAEIVNNITINKPVATARVEPIAASRSNIGIYKIVALFLGYAIIADNSISTLSKSVLGISEENTLEGNKTSVVVAGEITNVGWNLIPDSPVYLSTNGDITETIPTTGFLLKIGIALTTTSILVDIDLPIHL